MIGGGGVTRVDMGYGTYLRFRDLQVPDLDTASSEVRDFEFDVDRPLCLALPGSTHATSETTGHATTVLVVALYGRQPQLCAHEELLASAELLDLPDDGRLLGRVVHGSDVGAETGGVGVFRDWDEDFHIVGSAAALKLGLGLLGRDGVSLVVLFLLSIWGGVLGVPSTCTPCAIQSAIPPNIPPK